MLQTNKIPLYLRALLFLTLSTSSLIAFAGWSDLARNLSSEGSDKKHAVLELRKIKDLDAQLEKALKSPERNLALEVISSLKLTQFAPSLIQLTATDIEGFDYQVLNALMEPKTKDAIVQAYKSRLAQADPKKGAGAKIAMLQGLASAGEALPQGVLEKLLDDASFEVRLATVQYTRSFGPQFSKNGYNLVLQKALEKKPFQVRLAAVNSISTLPPEKIKQQGYRLEACRRDVNNDVKSACETLSQKVQSK